MSVYTTPKLPRRWPLLLVAPASCVAVWTGWVGLGEMTGFGPVHPLPGIWDGLTINTAITLPIGVEAYAAYALSAALTPARLSSRTRRFAWASAIGSLTLGALGQVAYHLLVAAGRASAPWPVTTLVAVLPVLVLGMAAALAHMIRGDADRPDAVRPVTVAGGGRSTDRVGAPDRSGADRTASRTDQTRSASMSAGSGDDRPRFGSSRSVAVEGRSIESATPTGRGPIDRGSIDGRADRDRARSIEDLRAELGTAIELGSIDPQPSAEQIRRGLRVSPTRARKLRDELRGLDTRVSLNGDGP